MLIQNTTYGKSCALEAQARHAFKYLATNQALISLSREELVAVANMRGFVNSTVIDLFKRLVDADLLSQFAIFNVASVAQDVPDILTFDEVSIDGKYLPGVPVGFDKPWVNITPLIGKRKSRSDTVTIADVPRACGYFVRANICASYHDKFASSTDTWLAPSLEVFVLESYSMTVALLLQRVYNLDFNETRLVQTLFAYFYAHQMSASMVEGNIPAILSRCGFLGSIGQIRTAVEYIQSHSDKPLHTLTFLELCNLLPKVGPDRMAKFESHVLIRLFTASAIDSQAMSLALDYPPYWIFQVLRYMAGAKNYIVGQAFNLPSIKRDSVKFQQSILTYRGFVHKR